MSAWLGEARRRFGERTLEAEVLREVMKTAPPVGEEPRLAGAAEAGNSLRGGGGMA